MKFNDGVKFTIVPAYIPCKSERKRGYNVVYTQQKIYLRYHRER